MAGAWVQTVRNGSNLGYIDMSPTAGNTLAVNSFTSTGSGATVTAIQAMSAITGGGSVLASCTIPSGFATTQYSTTNWSTGGYILSVPTGTASIKWTFSGGAAPGTTLLQAVEISGVTGYLTGTRQNQPPTVGTGTDAITSGAISVTAIPAYLLGVIEENSGNNNIVAGTSFTKRGTSTANFFVEDRRETGATGSYAATATDTTHGGTDTYTPYLFVFSETAPGLPLMPRNIYVLP